MNRFFDCCTADCPFRTAICHASCEEYKKAKEEHDKHKKSLRTAKLGDNELYGLRSDSVERYNRRCRRK